MANTCVVGLAFGDEGKGKIVDLLCSEHDVCVRYNGGANAGHTVVNETGTHKCHLLPIGALRGLSSYITAGVVIDPVQLHKEITGACLKKLDLYISKKAHIVLPRHKEEDAVTGKGIGTTNRGIGPCYADKAKRKGAMRMEDFMSESVEWVRDAYGDEYAQAREYLAMFVCDAESSLRERVKREESILFESANGIQLDVDHGTYPFVTSSAVGPAAIPQSCGLPNLYLDRIVGVTKCYMTRVGNGPFPTEIQDDNLVSKIRDKGNEFGTTTGRPRRIGWLDLKTLQQSIVLTGATEIALTHADTAENIIADIGSMKFRSLDEDPLGGHEYDVKSVDEIVDAIESELGRQVTLVGIGPETYQTTERATQ